MSNARFSILQARAVRDTRISDSQFRTLAALGMYADEDGWCFPSLTTIGKDLGKSKQAVGRDTIALKKLGYLQTQGRFDKKTGARRSNLYRLVFDLPARQPDVDAPSTTDVDAPSTTDVDVNDPVNPPLESGSSSEGGEINLFKEYEKRIGPITQMIADSLPDMEEEHTAHWVLEAFKVAEGAGKRSLNYVKGILNRWKAEGYGTDYKPTAKQKPAFQSKNSMNDFMSRLQEAARG